MNRIQCVAIGRSTGSLPAASERVAVDGKGRGSRRAARLAVLLLGSFAATPVWAVCAWSGGSGSWFNAGNWANSGRCSDVPTAQVSARINRSDSEVIIDGDDAESADLNLYKGRLTISNGGTLTSFPSSPFIGFNVDPATMTITGAGSAWNVEGTSTAIVVGRNGVGDGSFLILSAGGTLNVTGAGSRLILGNDVSGFSNARGTLVIGARAGQAPQMPGVADVDTIAMGWGSTASGRIVFNHTDTSGSYTFNSDITGNGRVEHYSGTTVLTGTNDYNGGTVIEGGMLVVNGSIDGSSVQIENGATLGGTGTVGSTTVEGGGTLAPGASIGTLTVDGDLDFSGGGTYAVEVDAAGNSDRIDATGTATLTGGTVEVQPLGSKADYGASTDYTVLTADGGLDGTFASVQSTMAFLDPSLSYDANNVYLNLRRNATGFHDVALTPNQRAVSGALEVAEGNGDLPALVDDVTGRSAEGARRAYDNLSGVQHTHAQLLALQQGRRFRGLLFDRLGDGVSSTASTERDSVQLAFAGEGWARALAGGAAAPGGAERTAGRARGLWVRAIGGLGDIDATDNASGADYTAGTLAIGADTELANGLVVGLAGGYGRTDADTAGGGLDVDSYQLAGYAGWSRDRLYANASLGVGRHRTDADRTVTVGGAPRTARADYDATQLSASLEAGRSWAWTDATAVTPFAGLDYDHLEREGFTETGAGAANLDVDEETTESVRSRLGVRLAGRFETAGGTVLEPRVELAWVHEFADRAASLSAHFDPAPATTFAVDGPELDRNRAAIGAGVTIRLSDTSRLDLEYAGELADSDRHHAIALTWRQRW